MYLFINPLGSACYHTEQNILKLGDSLNEKINFNFVPLMNFKTINDVMYRMNIPLNNVDIRNRLSENIYHSSIDFKAASFQGKKKGRNFLLNVQQLVVNDQKDYNFETIKLAAQKSGLDWDIFEQDRHSKLAIEAFKQDQELATEMNVTEHPTIVVYDCSANNNSAYSFSGCESLDEIKKVLLSQRQQNSSGTSIMKLC
ncbi:ClpXP adapter SpxH family protein [Ligilactobacillus salivarius]|uniref:ClpXP adapter SpxH family protein n=1 Tax=Ligilactobacillus salivarius TaxID=1624 RepID=UPI001CDABF3E|nr:ClpXP adapter SpxH family protein [Ligilactobacillus salivarius]